MTARAFAAPKDAAGGVKVRLQRARTRAEVARARGWIKRIGDLSDNLIGVGPFGIGIDGVLAWIPIVGTAYSLGAGAVLLAQGYRAHVPAGRLATAAAILAGRTAVGEVPILGDVVVDLFRGHRYAARLLQGAIDTTVYVQGSRAQAQVDPGLRAEVEAARAGRKRVVFLREG